MRKGRGGSVGERSLTSEERPGAVEGAVRRVRGHLRRRGGAAAALGVLAVAAVVLLLAWLVAGPRGWAPGTVLPLVLVTSGLAAAVGLTGWTVGRFGRWTSESRLTGEMERSARLPPGSVRAQLELGRRLPRGVSRSLSEAGERAAAARLRTRSGELAGEVGRQADRHFRSALGVAVVALGAVTVLAWNTPERARSAWSGLLHARALAAPVPLPPLAVHPGDARLPRGVPPEIRVDAVGRDSVTVHWRSVGEVTRSLTGEVVEGAARIPLPPLTERVVYWATAPDGDRTAEHELIPLEPLLLTDLVVEVRFPEHTRMPPELHRGSIPRLVLPEGSELRIRGGVAGEGNAVVLREEGDAVPEGDADPPEEVDGGMPGRAVAGPELARFPVRDGTFEGGWAPVRSLTAMWEVEGSGEPGTRLPSSLEVEVVPDEPPRVSLPVPGRDVELPVSLRLPLVLEAEDDHGVAWVELEAWGPRSPVVERIDTGDRRQVALRPVLDLSEWGLEPGDEVLLRARARDNAPTPATSETPVYRLRVPTGDVVREVARERIRETVARAGELAEGAARTSRQLRDLALREGRRSAQSDGGGSGFEERERLRETLETRDAELRELEEMRDALAEARRSLDADEGSEGLSERLRELERLLERVLEGADGERIRELLERMRSGEALPYEETLEELAQQQEELRDRIRENLERIRRAALEAALEGAEEDVRSLVDRQEELAPRMGDGESGAEQDRLRDRVAELERRLAALGEELEREGASEGAERVAEAAEALARSGGSMERAGEAARDEDRERAGREAERASEEAREALDRLEEARREWEEEAAEELREALRRTAQGALGLARRQEQLRARTGRADLGARREAESETAAVLRGLRSLAAGSALVGRHIPDLGAEFARAIDEAVEAVERTLAGSGPGSSSRALPGARDTYGGAVDAINRVALLALAALSVPEPDGEGEGGSSSMDELADALESLAGRQGELNEEAASLSEEREGSRAGERLEELAAGQQGIAERLQQLAGQSAAGGSSDQLGELAHEAQELARDLDGGRLDAELLDRQRGFLDRLLSAGRILERQGETDEREGTPAGPVERRVVDPLSAELLRQNAFPSPSVEELEALTPGERRLVLDYFERLNRRRAGGGNR